jgi:ribosomal protein S27AE
MRQSSTAEAKSFWEAIPAQKRTVLLNNVWCVDCGRPTTLVRYTGRLHQGDLVLEGECERCGSSVSRLVEGV